MKLNSKQRKILIIGVVVILLMGAVPPWTYTFKHTSTYSERPAGYYFIVSPPSPIAASRAHGIKIDASRLFIQWITTIVAVSIGLMLAAKKE